MLPSVPSGFRRLLSPRLRAGTLLAALVASGPALTLARPAAEARTYSPAQAERAEAAVTAVGRALDQLDQRLVTAYGEPASLLRTNRVRDGGPALRGGSAVTGEEVPGGPTVPGGRLLVRLASYEPLLAMCGLTSETREVLDILADETAALLETRHLAKPAERADWARSGNADGRQRLRQVHELNCGPVRRSLGDGLPALQSAYAQLHTARLEEPELPAAPVPVATTAPAPAPPSPPAPGSPPPAH